MRRVRRASKKKERRVLYSDDFGFIRDADNLSFLLQTYVRLGTNCGENYGVTNYANGWGKGVVHQCLESGTMSDTGRDRDGRVSRLVTPSHVRHFHGEWR